MDNINNLINECQQSIKSTQPLAEEQPSEKKLYRIDGELLTKAELLWKRMAGIYGGKWVNSYGGEPTPEWETCLDGIEPVMVANGLNKLVANASPYLPSAIEFRALCLPSDAEMGLIDKDAGYKEATSWKFLAQEEKSGEVLYIFQNNLIGDSSTFYVMSIDKARKLFAEAWEKMRAFVLAGGDLPKPVIEIEEKTIPVTKDEAVSLFAALRDDVGLEPAIPDPVQIDEKELLAGLVRVEKK